MNGENSMPAVKATAAINLLLGFWLFISPWVYRVHVSLHAWNSWIVGALIVIFAGARFSNPLTTRGLSFANLALGAWTFASPWILSYTSQTPDFVNSLCVGVIVFVLGAYGSSVGMGHTTGPPPVRT
jgi:hypothetical protein